MNRRRLMFARKLAALAALTTGTCLAFGGECVRGVLASVGATFF